MKRLIAGLLCIFLLMPLWGAYADDMVDEKIFKNEKGFSYNKDGTWSYYSSYSISYADAVVVFVIGLDGGGSIQKAPYLQIFIVDPKTKKTNFKPTGLDIAVGKTTYSYRKMRALSDGSAAVFLYKDGQKLVESLAEGDRLTITFHTIGKEFRSTVSSEHYNNTFRKAARLLIQSKVWDKLSSYARDYYTEQEEQYPMNIYRAK